MLAQCAACATSLPGSAQACPSCGAAIASDPALDPTIAAPGLAATRAVASAVPAERRAKSERDGDPIVGKVLLGQYVVRSLIGRGGMGAVYLADQPAMGRTAIVKILRPELSRHRESASRFDVEARAVSQLNHPHIVTIYNYGATEDGTLFLAMEHVDGQSLQEVVRRHKALATDRALAIARQIASALSEAHGHGVVHRDLKPSNVMIARRADGEEFVKVLDFGVAKIEGVDLTLTGFAFGTPPYMSPEQFSGGAVDGRADLYALGVVLFEMLAGKPPFVATNPVEYMNLHLTRPPPRLREVSKKARVPDAVERLIGTLLEKKAADRPASAEAFLRALDEAVATATTVAIATAPAPAHDERAASEPADTGPSTALQLASGVGRGWLAVQRAIIGSVSWVWSRTGARLRRRPKPKTLPGTIVGLWQRVRPRRRNRLQRGTRQARQAVKSWLRRLRKGRR